MFRLVKRETTNNNDGEDEKYLLSSQSTMELSFTSDMDSEDRSSCGSSDGLLMRQDSLGSYTIRGGLKRPNNTEVRRPNNLKVTFSQVSIRTYPVCVGDNPAVSLGVPISLDWHFVSEKTIPLDSYDACHHPRGKNEQELAIPASEREQMVRQAGFSTEDIRSAVRQVNVTKMERERTIDTLNNAAQEEFVEKLKKGIWNATFSRKHKKTERAILQQWRQEDAKRVLISPAC